MKLEEIPAISDPSNKTTTFTQPKNPTTHKDEKKSEMEAMSISLYQYMCKHIVGSEETVKTKRLLTTISDNLVYDRNTVTITSGSFGEGLEMKGSDSDYMYVIRNLHVYENKANIENVEWNESHTYFDIITDDTKIGFIKLQLGHTLDINIHNICEEYKGALFLSNSLFKLYFGKKFFPNYKILREINHGPCLSDKDGRFDFAFCLRMPSWISQADKWLTRPRGSWPSNAIVSKIINHGTLFVPIGVKGSPCEDIEWRISFSVGEKLLIYSFNHTRLICYALLKIVLKDIISADKRCKDLLCSYYLKNILFWLLEETSTSEWKPQNLIHCFMQCFKRLMYCVEYSVCPHYFIPENNMFENKIERENRHVLLDTLYALHNLRWQCILLSPQLQDCFSVGVVTNQSITDYFRQIYSSKVSFPTPGSYYKAVQSILSHKSKSLKLFHLFYLLHICQREAQVLQLKLKDTNKRVYRSYKTCKAYATQGLHCDVVSGWLHLASFYYQMKQYRKVLGILAYSLSKCSHGLIYEFSNFSPTQHNLISSNFLQRKHITRLLQLLRVNRVMFYKNSRLIPQELELDILIHPCFIPPVVYIHFLSFLCHYHLNDSREWRNSLVELLLIISEEHFIAHIADKSVSYNVLGVAFQMIGELDSAREAFQYASALDPDGLLSCAQQRLSMIN